MIGKEPICKRCALDELMENYQQLLEEYVDSMDDSIKTSQSEYERRIKLCSECGSLVSGTCGLCGCFVRARAAKKMMSCPSTPPKW